MGLFVMKICLKCNSKYDDKYKFCKRCGNTLSVVQKVRQSNVKFCPKCKLEYDNKYKFCKKCGYSLIVKGVRSSRSNMSLHNENKNENENKAILFYFYLFFFTVMILLAVFAQARVISPYH